MCREGLLSSILGKSFLLGEKLEDLSASEFVQETAVPGNVKGKRETGKVCHERYSQSVVNNLRTKE